MNIDYQIAKHLAAHRSQWPTVSRQEAEKAIRRALLSGNAWHYQEPQQLELAL